MSHKILLADDSITIQKVVNLTFTDEGIDVVTVGNGELALKKLREDVFDLVLADIFMPGRNGYEVCEYVKGQPNLSRVPVILLVGAFEPFDRSEASRVRADGHLTKPFESRILVETVKRMLAQAQPRPAEPPARPVESAWSVQPVPMTPTPEQGTEQAAYDPYAATAKITPATASVDAPTDQTMVIGSPFSSPGTEPFGQTSADVFHFNLSGALSGTVPPPPPEFEEEEAPPIGYTTQPHEPFEQEHEEEVAEPPETAPFGGAPPEAPSWDVPPAPGETADFGVVESHAHEPVYVSEEREPLLDTFDDVARSTAGVDAVADPALVANAQPEGEPSTTVRPVEGLTTGWDVSALPAGFRPDVADEASTEDAAELAADEADYGRTQSYSPASMRPFDAAQPTAVEPADAAPAPPAYDANRTQAYRFDLAPFQAAEQEVEALASDEEAAPVAEAARPADTMMELPIEIVEAPEMPEPPPPPPSSLPAASFNFDPTRTQAYEFGLPPFEQAEEDVEPEESSAGAVWGEPALPDASTISEASVAETSVAGTGTGDLDFTPPPPPISDEPLEAAFADTAPLHLGANLTEYVESAEAEAAEAEEFSEASADGGAFVTAESEPVVAEPEPEAYGLADIPDEEVMAEAADEVPREAVEVVVEAPAEERGADEYETAEETPVEEAEVAPVNGSQPSGGMDLVGVPQDVIDEIVRRTVERMSDDVIREIAWEVVPDLAARMIRKHLAERQ